MSIDRSISEIRRTIDSDPDDPNAQQRLKSLASRIRFLQKHQIVDLFKTKYSFKGIGAIEIQLDQIAIIEVKTCRPGIIIGRKGMMLTSIKKDLEEIVGENLDFRLTEIVDCNLCLKEWKEATPAGYNWQHQPLHEGISSLDPKKWAWNEKEKRYLNV